MSFVRKDTGGRLDSPKATASGDFWKPSSDMESCSVCHVPSPTSAVWIALPEQLLLWNQSFLKHPFFSGHTLTHLLWLCSQDRFFFFFKKPHPPFSLLRIRMEVIIYKLKVNPERHCAWGLMSKESQNRNG